MVATISKTPKDDYKEIMEQGLEELIDFTDIKIFKLYKSLNNYYIHENRSRKQIVYKYMSLDGFIRCIEKGYIMFQEPSGWEDQYEKRFYLADYSNISQNNADTPQMYATCTTMRRDNEAAWKVYARGKSGLDSKCVQLKIDLKQFRKCLDQYAAINKFKVYEGNAFYGLYEKGILGLHDKASPWYNMFFKSFNVEKFIALHLLKRPAYAYEEEVRFFMVPQETQPINTNARKAEKLSVDVPWTDLIKEIRIDKRCTDAEILAIKTICKGKGLQFYKKQLNKKTTNTGKIPFVRFDIDKMPGRKRIKIG